MITPVVVLISHKTDVIRVLLFDMGNIWHIDVHGHNGVLFAFVASALGGVPKQILQRRRIQVHATFLSQQYLGEKGRKCSLSTSASRHLILLIILLF